jgi:hypothetical protein
MNTTLHFTGTDELDLKLIETEISTSFISLLITILFILSGQKAKQIILQRAIQQQQVNSSSPTPSEISAFALCLNIFTILIFTRIAFIRFNEIYDNIQSGNSQFSIIPNIYITTGFVISTIATLLITIGAIKRVNEEAQITIL